MNLPEVESAIVEEGKIVAYLLSPDHARGRHKAVFFESFGFARDEWGTLAAALVRHAMNHDVVNVEANRFGLRYTVYGPLETPDGRAPLVKSVWFIKSKESNPRLVTAYPMKRHSL